MEFLYGRPEILLESQMKEIKNIECIKENRLEKVIPLSIKVQNLVSILKRLPNPEIHLCNPSLIKEIVSKLPFSKREQWIRYALSIRPYYTLENLSTWLSQEAQYMSLINPSYFIKSNTATNQSDICKCCKDKFHLLVRCPKFKQLSINNRRMKAKELDVCFACLRAGHYKSNCQSKRICDIKGCKGYHNRHLHKDPPESRINLDCNVIEGETEPPHLELRSPETSTISPESMSVNNSFKSNNSEKINFHTVVKGLYTLKEKLEIVKNR